MRENKNIERLFQEKFKDFEANPPEDAWNVIASRIEKKKNKRRVIPLWFKATGIAACLVVGIFLLLPSETDENNFINSDKKIVLEKNNNNKEENNNTIYNNTIKKSNSDIVSTKENNNLNSEEKNPSKNNNLNENPILNKSNSNDNITKPKNNAIVNVTNEKNKLIPIGNKEKINQEIQNTKITNGKASLNENKALANHSNSSKVTLENKSKLVEVTSTNEKAFVILTNKKLINNDKESLTKSEEKSNSNDTITNKNPLNTIISGKVEDQVVEKLNTKNSNLVEEKTLLKDKVVGVTQPNQKTKNTTNVINDSSIEIQKNEISKKALVISNEINKDSTMTTTEALAEVNVLEQLLKEKEAGENAVEKEKEKRDKWVISSNAAPVYFNSISDGSPIDEQFSNNEKSYATSLSYGVGLQYNLNEKISIRSGINAININYNTNNVYYSSTLNPINATSLNIDQNVNAENLVLRNAPSADANILSADVENMSEATQASLNQEMGYIEIPLEMTYKILDKKFGIEVIGGMSTLLLNKNNISLVSNGSEMVIGEANNLNNIHFSSNVGLGFNYNFLKSFQFNIQPVFKYQINTFNSNSGNFKPYIVGLYSGISFSF